MQQTLAHLAELGSGSGPPPEIMFGSLDKIVDTVASLGNVQRGGPLVETIRAAATERMGQNDANYIGNYYLVINLIKCSYALSILGEDERPNFNNIFKLLKNFDSYSQDEYRGVLVDCIKKLSGEIRYWLAYEVLKSYDGEASRENLRNLISVVVGGEDAYIKALQQWKNIEERIIRDRIVNETL
jgi:hypothetical protein